MHISYMRLITLILVLFCTSCDMRISSEKRFYTNIGFSLPADKKVLKDEYQDMDQDYVITYEVELSMKSNQELTARISHLISKTDNDCSWSTVDNGFNYMCNKGRMTYKVLYNTLSRKLIYQELSD